MTPLRLRGTSLSRSSRSCTGSRRSSCVLQTANRSADFFATAARSGRRSASTWTRGCVLILAGGRWAASRPHHDSCGDAGPAGANGWGPSRRVLDRLAEEKRTLWREPERPDEAASLVAGSPRWSPRRSSTARGRGHRRPLRRAQAGGAVGGDVPRIMKVDAMLMELLASGVAAGLARLEQEKAALAARVQFEQFFTPELASELAARPDLLKGRERRGHAPVLRHPRLQPDQRAARPGRHGRVDRRRDGGPLRLRPGPPRACSSTTSATS